MTQSIDRISRERAAAPPAPRPVLGEPARLLNAVRAFTGAATIAGVVFSVLEFAGDASVHLVGPAVGCFILAGMGANSLVIQYLLADRQEFYRRGHLDGWMKGWNGEMPERHDPLLK